MVTRRVQVQFFDSIICYTFLLVLDQWVQFLDVFGMFWIVLVLLAHDPPSARNIGLI